MGSPDYLAYDLTKAMEESPGDYRARVVRLNPAPHLSSQRVLIEMRSQLGQARTDEQRGFRAPRLKGAAPGPPASLPVGAFRPASHAGGGRNGERSNPGRPSTGDPVEAAVAEAQSLARKRGDGEPGKVDSFIANRRAEAAKE